MRYYLIISSFTLFISLITAYKVAFYKVDLSVLKPPIFYMKWREKFIWFAIFIYFIAFSSLAIIKYTAYNMGMVDLGRIDQTIWNIRHGRFFLCTFNEGNFNRLSAHTELIYLLISPLYLIFSDPRALLILQALVISMGALPIYWLVKKKLGSSFTALCLSCAYLLYPSLQYGNLLDFHPDMLATTLLLFTFYYLDQSKWARYFVFLLLALMCKEYVSLIAVTLGIYIFFRMKNIRIGSITFFIGIFFFFMAYKVIPGFLAAGKQNDMMVHLYPSLGKDIGEICKTVLLHPVSTFLGHATFEKISTFILVFLPVGFLSFFSFWILAISSPIIAGLFLSPVFTYTNHHLGTIIPFIFISTIFAGKFIVDRYKPRLKNIGFAFGVFVLSNSLLSSIFYGASPLSWRFWHKASYRFHGNVHQFKITEHDRIADTFIKQLPKKGVVTASNHLGAHLSNRETIYHFPHPGDFGGIDFVLVDLLEYFPPHWGPRKNELNALRGLFSQDMFGLRRWQDGILFFERNFDKRQSYNLGISVVKDVSPEIPFDASFGGRLKLKGFDFDFIGLSEDGYKYRIAYYWQVLSDFKKRFYYSYFGTTEELDESFIVVDTFKNQNGSHRIVHLPTFIMYTPQEWNAGENIREEFEFSLPQDINTADFSWNIGLYPVAENFFIQTEPKRLVPGTNLIVPDINILKKKLL